jgi:undecaprenyl diphosphate synthase
MFFRKKVLNKEALPKHIGFIIDGNGRWAKERGLTRSMGHKAGMLALKEAIKNSFELGIKFVSIYGFSTENWNRPKDEVNFLFNLFREFIKSDFNEVEGKNARLNIMGDYTKFPDDLVKEIEKALEETKNNDGFVLNLGINYGGRDEIIRAVNNIINSGVKEITKENFNDYLYTKGLPDPDFIVRTSGEQRISNFMLWQNAYSEFYFPKTYWPDFNKKELIKSLLNYQQRNRRFGAIKENK